MFSLENVVKVIDMNYEHQLNKVIDFIGKNLDEKLSLDELCAVACLSKYHFHRLFTAFTGLSLKQYIRWLRLKRAAHQLVIDRERSIIEIAIDAGFKSHESFTRAFKQTCGYTPSEVRTHKNWSEWEKPAYCIAKRRGKNMNVNIENLDERRLAVVEHRNSCDSVGDSLIKLIDWAKLQSIDLKPKPGESFGFAYDDPKTTPTDEFRFDIGIRVPENFKLNDSNIVEKHLPSGRYAVCVHKGSRDSIAETVYYLYRNWLPESGEELGDLPCVFRYYNFEYEVAETELVTECMLLLKD